MSLLTGKRMKISYLQAKCPGKGYRRAPDRSLDDKNRFAMVVFQWSYQLVYKMCFFMTAWAQHYKMTRIVVIKQVLCKRDGVQL